MAGRKVNGIISVSVQFDENNLKLLDQLQLPLISLGVKVSNQPMISIDNLKAATTGTNYLISRGYQRIALIAVDTSDPQTGRTRCAGYQKAMESAGLTPSIIPGDYSFAAGKQAAELLLAKGELPEAILQPVTMPQPGLSMPLRNTALKYLSNWQFWVLTTHQ